MFQKKDQLIGLDIGSRSIKAAQISDSKKGRTLERFGVIDIPHGLIEDGVIKDAASVADAIRQLLKTNRIKEQNVAISVGGYAVIVKKITIPFVPDAQLQETVTYQAEQYIPFDISDVNLDYQKVEAGGASSGQMDVLLVAAKKENVNDYVNLVQMAGLTPCIVDVDAFALQNIYEYGHSLSATENVALIDVGASKTSLNILKGSVSVFMRDVSMGGGQIDQKIASRVGCSLADAEDIKLGGLPEKLSPGDLSGLVSSVVSDWCGEIRRALDFFYSTSPGDQVKNIVLSGGGGNIREFKQLLSVETSAEVAVIDPFAGFYIDEGRLDVEFLKSIAPQASISMGLATRKVDDK